MDEGVKVGHWGSLRGDSGYDWPRAGLMTTLANGLRVLLTHSHFTHLHASRLFSFLFRLFLVSSYLHAAF